jgi:hypothetical protein
MATISSVSNSAAKFPPADSKNFDSARQKWYGEHKISTFAKDKRDSAASTGKNTPRTEDTTRNRPESDKQGVSYGYILTKHWVLDRQADLDNLQAYFDKRSAIRHPCISEVQKVNANVHKGFCSQSFEMQVDYEFYYNNLELEFAKRKLNDSTFSIVELYSILHDAVVPIHLAICSILLRQLPYQTLLTSPKLSANTRADLIFASTSPKAPGQSIRQEWVLRAGSSAARIQWTRVVPVSRAAREPR